MPKSIVPVRPDAIFFADAHLDTHNWVGYPQLSGDSISSFTQICDYAIKNKIGRIIGAGDLIDVTEPSSVVVSTIREAIARLSDEGIAFYYIQGQHELASPPWMSAIHSGAKHLHNSHISLESGQTVYGLDWQPADLLAGAMKRALEYADKRSIFVCHQVWEEFMGGIAACEGSLYTVPHVKTVFTGDYHKNVVTRLVTSSGGTIQVISPGSTNLRAINEPVVKYFYVHYIDGSWERKRLTTRKVLAVSIDDDAQLERIVAKLPAVLEKHAAENPAFPNPILRVKYHADVRALKARMKAAAGDRGYLFFEPYHDAAVENSDTVAARKAVIRGGIPALLGTVAKEQGIDTRPLVRLLNAESPKDELAAMKQERLDALKGA